MGESVFYQGEDINFEIDCFNIEDQSTPVDIAGIDFLLLVYTDKNEPIKFCTKTTENYLPLTLEENKLVGKIPSFSSRILKPGKSILEVKLRNNGRGNWISIAKIPFVEILSSEIKDYDIPDNS